MSTPRSREPTGSQYLRGFDNAAMTVYNLQGIAVKTSVEASEALSDLPAGIYIVNGRKVLKKLQ